LLCRSSVEPLFTIEALILFFMRGEPKVFAPSKTQDTKSRETFIKQTMNTVLQSPIEVDDDIAANDEIEFVEASISGQIMLGEYDVCLQRTVQNGMVIAGGVVIGEAFLAAGFRIVITILRDTIHR